jgi:hypothetical protein
MRKRVDPSLSALVSFALLLLVSIVLRVAARPALAEQGLCSQPVTNGEKPAATDCLFILKVAVATETCSPGCICAPKGTLPTTSTDALICLQYVVGQPLALACPCSPPSTCPPTTTTTLLLCGDSLLCSEGLCLNWQECTVFEAEQCGCPGPPVPCGDVSPVGMCRLGECPAGKHCRATSAGWPDCFGYCACF